MRNALMTHRVNNVKARIEAHEYMGQPEKAESFRELMRMVNRGHIETLTKMNQELKKRNLNLV